MKVGNSFIYKIKKCSCHELLINVLNYINNMELKYTKILFEIRDYDFLEKKYSKKLGYLMQRKDLDIYKKISEFNNRGVREITFSNYHVTDETRQLDKLLVDILTVIGNSLFWDIIFSDINWGGGKSNNSGKDFNYIKVSNEYDGVFIELNFEVNNKIHDYGKYINEYEIEIESKFRERQNNVMMSADERMMYSDIDKTVRKKFEKLQNSLRIDFEVLLESPKSKINFGNLLRRKQDLDYTYLCYVGGAYEIYRYDKYNNCIKIIYSFDQNLKQLASTIKYIVPYNVYAYGIRMPVINQYICKENIEHYIIFSKKIADKLVELYENSVNDKISMVPDYLDLKYQTMLTII